ncbi:hypothetical protein FCV25MIE_16142 [Fagus crenata]
MTHAILSFSSPLIPNHVHSPSVPSPPSSAASSPPSSAASNPHLMSFIWFLMIQRKRMEWDAGTCRGEREREWSGLWDVGTREGSVERRKREWRESWGVGIGGEKRSVERRE